KSPAPAAAASPASTVLLDVMQRELKRAMAELAQRDPAPYYISYSVTERYDMATTAMQGALFNSAHTRLRIADISVRVASPMLDNTHNEGRPSAVRTVLLPIEEDPEAIARVLWQATD